MRWLAALVVVTVLALSGRAGADDVPTSRLGADVSVPGVISLGFFGNPGATVYFDERSGSIVKRIGSLPIGSAGYVVMKEAAVWRCDRLERHFEATAVNPDGTRSYGSYDVRTGSCAQRFKIVAPPRVAVARTATVQVFDRWRIGGYPTLLCFDPPKGPHSCRVLPFPRGVSVGSRDFKAAKPGVWTLELRVNSFSLRHSIVVGDAGAPAPAVPTILATGDSTMQGIDSYLSDLLGPAANVRGDVYPGTGISRTLAWVTRAAQQAARTRPRTTVISIGAGEGVAMPLPDGSTAECCDDPWVSEYTRRVSSMMDSYSRGGKGRVLWLLLPTPRSALLAAITQQVNRAIRKASQGRPTVRLLPLNDLFTPNGYSDVIHYRGQDVRVRAVDGVHLNTAGTAIAAEAIELALRAWPDTGIPPAPK